MIEDSGIESRYAEFRESLQVLMSLSISEALKELAQKFASSYNIQVSVKSV